MLIFTLFRKFFFKILKVAHNTRRKFMKLLWTSRLKNTAKEYGTDLHVCGKCEFNGQLYLGNNVSFNGMIIQGKGTVRIGNNFRSGIECMMVTQNHDYDTGDALPFGKQFDYKTITIGDNVWLGNRVTITGDTTIGEGAIVAAGSLVCKDVPPLAIVGGNPAKVLKYRNEEHYNRLKKEQKFASPKRRRWL